MCLSYNRKSELGSEELSAPGLEAAAPSCALMVLCLEDLPPASQKLTLQALGSPLCTAVADVQEHRGTVF